MLLDQSFNFLVRTYKAKDADQKDQSLETAYKRKKLECCNDSCRVDQLCLEIWADDEHRTIIQNYIEMKAKNEKNQRPSVNMQKVAETLREIQLGNRELRDRESTLDLCSEMFNAGYAEALIKHNQ